LDADINTFGNNSMMRKMIFCCGPATILECLRSVGLYYKKIIRKKE
jgi:hypothetical protein